MHFTSEEKLHQPEMHPSSIFSTNIESTRFLLKYTNLVRYDKPFNSLPFLSAIIVSALTISNLFMVVLYEQNTEKRLKAMAEIVCMASLYSCVVQRGLKPDVAIKLINLIEGELLVDCGVLSAGKINLGRIYANYEKKREDMERLYKKMFIASSGIYLTGLVGRNALNEILEGKPRSERAWPTIYFYYCPSGYDSFFTFMLIEALHIYVFSSMLAEGFCFMLSTCLATERVLADFQTIYMLLEDLSEHFKERDIEFDANYKQSNQEIGFSNRNIKMRDLENYMALLIRCHQTLNRNFKYCADYAAYGTLAITFPISIDTATGIYNMLKATNVKLFVNFAVSCVFVNLIILFCYHNGQKIVNQNDILRKHLIKVPWIDKPKWFKTSLCIMMRRANIDTEIKPYNIFVLNHESFKNILKAAFSYGNIIYSVKSNK